MNIFNEDDYGGLSLNEIASIVRNPDVTREELIEVLAKIIIEAYEWEQKQKKVSEKE